MRLCGWPASAVGLALSYERVAAWYASYGALALLDAPLTLLLPLDLVAAAIRATGQVP